MITNAMNLSLYNGKHAAELDSICRKVREFCGLTNIFCTNNFRVKIPNRVNVSKAFTKGSLSSVNIASMDEKKSSSMRYSRDDTGWSYGANVIIRGKKRIHFGYYTTEEKLTEEIFYINCKVGYNKPNPADFDLRVNLITGLMWSIGENGKNMPVMADQTRQIRKMNRYLKKALQKLRKEIIKYTEKT